MISVIMSTHNRGVPLKRALESILNQTYKNFEFIICDDSSTDDTYKVLRHYESIDDRIKIIHNENNLGLQKSLNKCLKVSSGEFIARMDDDDFAIKNRFEEQINFLKKNPEYAFVGSNEFFYSDQLGVYGEEEYPSAPSKVDLIKRCQFAHPAIMIRSDVIKKFNGYSESKKYYRVEDYELWLRLYHNGYRGYNLQQKLIIYTKDSGSIKNIRKIDRINRFKLTREYFYKLDISRKYYVYVYLPLIKMLVPSKIRTVVNYFKYHRKEE